MEDTGTYSADFLEEHYPVVIADRALQKLAAAN
jgi:adapter protein MecA 1/2